MRLWHELVRPRGPVRHRFYRGWRRSKAGVALLMAISAIMMLTVLVTEIAHGAVVRAQLAGQHRDEVKAEALAYSGAQFYRMILMASAAIGRNPMVGQLAAMMGMNATELWQAIPFIDTRLMRMVFVSDGRTDEDDVAETVAAGGLSDEQIEESRGGGSSLLGRPFLDFDGDFHASVKDEERRIYVGQFQAQTLGDLLVQPAAQQIMAMLSREDFHDFIQANNIVKEELVANLADWTDADDVRLYQGGSEDGLYQRLDEPYRAKNQPFDTLQEMRLVEGWHIDGIWERVGKHLTIYGTGQINVNTATHDVLKALLMAHAEGVVNETTVDPALSEFLALRGRPLADGGMYIASPQQFVSFFETQMGLQLRDDIERAITTQSKVFRITSAGEVGNARVEVQAILDFTNDPTGRVMYWRVR
ncbi:MAG: general secretion pathway protein GspK [Myxococcales bacterium]|nr:general secretion pathway protein GspK [Myxococcales bacterium]